MASPKTPELNNSADGLPRRRAIQGIAGSLAGIAALGAVNASSRKKNKVGKLARFDMAAVTESIPTGSMAAPSTVIRVDCPAPGKKQQVYATGGGYETTQTALTMFAISSQVTSDLNGWEVEFMNAAPDQDATVSVVCAYFKKK